MKDKTIRRVLIFFLIISAVLVAVAVTTLRNISRSVASSDWVNHTHATILAVDGVQGAVHAADAAMRSFLMTGDPRDRVACREALDNVAENLEVAKALTRSEPAQQEQVQKLEKAATARIEFSRKVLAAKQSAPDSLPALLSAEGGEAMKNIERAVQAVKNDEMALLAERDTASYRQAQATRWTVWSGAVLDFVLLIGVGWLIRDDIAARHRLSVALQQANEHLESLVRQRTGELASANDHLKAENLERRWSNQALQHQLRYNELIVNSISDAVIVLTKVLNVSRINPALAKLTGREPSELINRPITEIVLSSERSSLTEVPLHELMTEALREGRDLRDQKAEVVDRAGRRTKVRLTLFPLRDHDKVVGGVVILQHGSAERIQA